MNNRRVSFRGALLAATMLSHDAALASGMVPQLCQQQQANYTAPLLSAPVATTFKTAGAVWAAATARRIQLYEAEMGQTGALATTDCQCQWDISRFGATAVMAGTTVATNLADTADIASLALFMNNQTAEPTYTTAGNGLSLKSWAWNQRGSYRWRALDDGDNIMVPATNLVGLGLRTLSSNFTASAVGNLSIVER